MATFGEDGARVRREHNESMHAVLMRQPSIGDDGSGSEDDDDETDRSIPPVGGTVAVDDRLRRTVDEFDDLPETEKADYRAAFEILVHGTRRNGKGDGTKGKSDAGAASGALSFVRSRSSGTLHLDAAASSGDGQ